MIARVGLLLLGAVASVASTPRGPTSVRTVASADWTRTVAPTPAGGMRMGNPNAPVKLVEYGSRVCSHCARFAAEGFPLLKAQYIASGKVSYEFRDFPVAGMLDLAPIILGRCVSPQQYFPVLDRMFEAQDTLLANAQAEVQNVPPKASPNEVALQLARTLGYLGMMERSGFSRTKMIACLRDPRAVQRIATETSRVRAIVRGTPTFLINGKLADGVMDWASLDSALATLVTR